MTEEADDGGPARPIDAGAPDPPPAVSALPGPEVVAARGVVVEPQLAELPDGGSGEPGVDGGQVGGSGEPESEEDRLAIAQEDALDFVEGLLEAMDLEGEVTAETRDRRVYVSVEGDEVGVLIGHHGQTLDAVQEILRSAIQRQLRARVWVTLDVQGYRERRKTVLQDRAREMAAKALDEGEVEFEPMNAFERKIVHDAIGDIAGVRSFSEGEDPYRRVIIAPAED